MDSSSEISIFGVWGNESNEYDLSSKAEEFGDLSDTTDVLSTVFGGESKILVETSSDDISIKNEDLFIGYLSTASHCSNTPEKN